MQIILSEIHLNFTFNPDYEVRNMLVFSIFIIYDLNFNTLINMSFCLVEAVFFFFIVIEIEAEQSEFLDKPFLLSL